jgi:hypothetical protein
MHPHEISFGLEWSLPKSPGTTALVASSEASALARRFKQM